MPFYWFRFKYFTTGCLPIKYTSKWLPIKLIISRWSDFLKVSWNRFFFSQQSIKCRGEVFKTAVRLSFTMQHYLPAVKHSLQTQEGVNKTNPLNVSDNTIPQNLYHFVVDAEMHIFWQLKPLEDHRHCWCYETSLSISRELFAPRIQFRSPQEGGCGISSGKKKKNTLPYLLHWKVAIIFFFFFFCLSCFVLLMQKMWFVLMQFSLHLWSKYRRIFHGVLL